MSPTNRHRRPPQGPVTIASALSAAIPVTVTLAFSFPARSTAVMASVPVASPTVQNAPGIVPDRASPLASVPTCGGSSIGSEACRARDASVSGVVCGAVDPVGEPGVIVRTGDADPDEWAADDVGPAGWAGVDDMLPAGAVG